jgi:hypothetical protein
MPILFTNVRVAPHVDSGTGGMPFQYQPPSSAFALVGFLVRAGSWIDQVTPIFAELFEDGTLGPDVMGPVFGGHGGTSHELRVAPGHVVTGLQTRSGNYVDAIRLLQTRWDGSLSDETSWTPWCGSADLGGVMRAERLAEPAGATIAVGIAGRAGGYLDNLTIITASIARVQGAMLSPKTTTSRSTRQSNAVV